jgi:selenide,water dikinase
MTKPSGVDAQISLSALPLLDGAVATVAAGIVSSLQTANVRLRRALHNQTEFVTHPRYPLLFDPQTAGGLLASVPADRAAACLAELHVLGYTQAAVIGQVRPMSDAQAPIVLLD